MKDKKKILLRVALIFLLGLFFILPAVQAAISLPTPEEAGGLSNADVKTILENFLKWLLSIAGSIALIGFVVSGIMYLVSAGNDEMATKAKKYMTYCLIGVVVMLSAFVIIKAIDAMLRATGSY